MLEKLLKAGHNVSMGDTYFATGYGGGRVQAISVSDGIITANNDRRKDGQNDGY